MIELMIVVAIIGILASIALPAYQDYTVRAKTSEALMAGGAAKALISEAYQTDNIPGMNAAAAALNAVPSAQKRSKFVANVCAGDPSCPAAPGTPWAVHVILSATAGNGLPLELNGKTLVLSPNLRKKVPEPDVEGGLDWACASESDHTAAARELTNRNLGTLPAKYAPSECR